MSSLSSKVPAPLAAPYAATKSAIESATDCLRLELAPWKIRLSLIIPGFVDTPTFEKTKRAGEALRNDPENPYRELMFDLERFVNRQLERAITPQAVAEVVLEAATAERPRERYYVPLSSRIVAELSHVLPQGSLDRLLLKVYKVPV